MNFDFGSVPKLGLKLSLRQFRRVCVDRISSVVLRGISHEGRLIGRDACDREQEGNRDIRVDRFGPSTRRNTLLLWSLGLYWLSYDIACDQIL